MNSLSTWYKSGQCEITCPVKNIAQSTKITSPLSVLLSTAPLLLVSVCQYSTACLWVNWWVCIWSITLQFITECECPFLSSIIISTCSLLSYFSSAFLWNCCWHIRHWRGTRLLWSLWQTLAKNYFPIGSHRLAPPNLSWIILATCLTCLMHTRCLPTHHGKVSYPPALLSGTI